MLIYAVFLDLGVTQPEIQCVFPETASGASLFA